MRPPSTIHFPNLGAAREHLTNLVRVGSGEGFAIYAGLFDGQPCVVTDEGTMADFLDAEDDADLLASLVRVDVFDGIAERDDRVGAFSQLRR